MKKFLEAAWKILFAIGVIGGEVTFFAWRDGWNWYNAIESMGLALIILVFLILLWLYLVFNSFKNW